MANKKSKSLVSDWKEVISWHSSVQFQCSASCQAVVDKAVNAVQDYVTGGGVLTELEVNNLICCLKKILQYWNKGSQSPDDIWSPTCIKLSGVLAEVLTQDGITPEYLSKSSKLVGFTLVKSTSMGEGNTLISLMAGSYKFVNSFSSVQLSKLRDSNVEKMFLYFAQTTAELCIKISRDMIQAGSALIRELINCVSECMREQFLVIIQRGVKDEANKKKLLQYMFETINSWTLWLDSTGVGIAPDNIYRTRNQLFCMAFKYPSAAIFRKIIDQSTRHLNILLKTNCSTRCICFCDSVGLFMDKLLENLINDFRSLDIATRICLWRQELRSPSASSILPDYCADKFLAQADSLLESFLESQSLNEVPSEAGWSILTAIVQVLKGYKNGNEVNITNCVQRQLVDARTCVSDVSKELLCLLFVTIVDYDKIRNKDRDGGDVSFVSGDLLQWLLFSEGEDCNHIDDDLAMTILLACSKQLLQGAYSTSPHVFNMAFDMKFAMLSLHYFTENVCWTKFLENSSMDNLLKLISNTLLHVTESTVLVEWTEFESCCSVPFFSALSSFSNATKHLFSSNIRNELLEKLPLAFDTLGSSYSIIMHCGKKLGCFDTPTLCKLDLMDSALEVFDLINVDPSEKLMYSVDFAKFVLEFCTEYETPIPKSFLENRGDYVCNQWNSEICKLSHFVNSEKVRVVEITSCRHDAIEHYIQAIRETIKKYMDNDQKRVDLVNSTLSIVDGLNVITRHCCSPLRRLKFGNALELLIYSLLIWKGTLSNTDEKYGIGEFNGGYIVEALKSNLLLKKSNANSQFLNDSLCHEVDTIPEEYLLSLKFKSALLLLQWSLYNPSGVCSPGESNNPQQSDFGLSIPVESIVLVAFSIWERVCCAVVRGAMCCTLVDFLGDTYNLFNFLGIYGHVPHQIQLLIQLSKHCKECEISSLKRKKCHLVRILKSFMELWMCFNGIQSLAIHLENIECESTPWSTSISEYLNQCQDILHASKNEKSKDTVHLGKNDETFKKWTTNAECLFQKCRGENFHILASLIALCHSKFLLLATGYHESSLLWAKYAVSAVCTDRNMRDRTPDKRILTVDSTPIEMEGMLLVADLHEMTGSLDRCLSYMTEAKALSCCCSSTILKGLCSIHSVRILYRLNSKKLRSEFSSLSNDNCEMYKVNEDSYHNKLVLSNRPHTSTELAGRVYRSDESVSFLHGKINSYVAILTKVISNIELELEYFEDDNCDIDLSYRHITHYWNISSATKDILTRISSQKLHNVDMKHSIDAYFHLQREFHCALSYNMRTHVETVLSCQSVQDGRICFSGLSSNYSLDALKIHLKQCVNGIPASQSNSFDILRSLRRRYSYDCLSGLFITSNQSVGVAVKRKAEELANGNSLVLKAMYAFALGAASCGTSVETSLENKSDLARNRSSKLAAACDLVDAICLGDDNKLRLLMDLLNYKSPSMRVSGELPVVTCFLVLEHSTKQLIIGRKDSNFSLPFVVSVSCYDTLMDCLKDWEEIKETNCGQLGRTKDQVEIKTWTHDEKQAWWTERDMIDKRIREFMINIQKLLGVWRCLLCSKRICRGGFSNDVDTKIKSKLCDLIKKCGESTATKKPAKARPVKMNGVKSFHDDESTSEVLMNWIYFISENETLSSEEQIETFAQLLRHAVDPPESFGVDIDIHNVATEIWNLIFDFKSSCGNCDSDSSDSTIEPKSTDNEKFSKKYLEGLKVTELRALLKENNLALSGKKVDLVDRLCQHFAPLTHSGAPIESTRKSSSLSGDSHVVLILDELLHAIPFENMPMLHHKEVSRVPGLTVLINLILLHTERDDVSILIQPAVTKVLSPANCWYTIDPDANLSDTRSTMVEFITPYANKWGWTGFVGEKPPPDSIKNVHENSDLFVYCGHGGGEKLFEKQNKLRKLRCPAAMLWGCSSGALSRNGVHDPVGTSISYLLGGAPFVIGNLWDVTDRDIDKLSVCCMSHIFGEKEKNSGGDNGCAVSVSRSLSLSRDVCKLKAAVGFSPVLYGLPVGVDN